MQGEVSNATACSHYSNRGYPTAGTGNCSPYVDRYDWKFGGTSSIANNNDERRDHFTLSLGMTLMFQPVGIMPCQLSLTALRRRALPITLTDDRDIAAAAMIGDNSNPVNG